ncbi:GLUG motif-containing protein [uncultured Oscillibacter sp.]|uniref:GLUG motif-containing protein n=1 Tax=uncultured Oscillibacter sp. TaxID=876091 RepID=UPI0025F9FC2B|nr:GLUG motif-containing protein [uncultured Oscillibacter sp.]
MKRIKRLSALLAAILIFTLTAPAAAAAEDMISVRTAEDLLELSRKCMLDSWSQGKIVTLEADVDLTGAEFEPIPTFGGTFRGQDHRITGLSLTGSGNVRGLFRYIQAGATVQDLTVEGTVSPKDRQDDLGLLAGVNYGTVVNCSAGGSVSGDNRIGGLVGTNETGGQIISCKFTGSVTGKHSAAGIAGENRGTLARCVNYGSVNTRDLEDAPKTDYTNLQQLNSMENAPVYTDIGGVAGLSDGTVQSCRNEGAVGYEHIGCNIGGVAGRSSGWLDGCVNTGVVLGRKDVGGVVGQLEPEAVQSFSRDFLDKLLDELDRLTNLMDRTTGDADRTADAVSAQLDDLSEKAHSTREIAGGLIDSMTDWTNNNIDQINELSARVSWALDQLTPILNDTVDMLGDVDKLLDELNKVRKELYFVVDRGDDAAKAFIDALDSLQTAAAILSGVVSQLQQALPNIDPSNPAEILPLLQALISELGKAMEQLNNSCEEMQTALKALRNMGGNIRRTLDLLGDVHDAAGEVTGSLGTVTRGLRDMVKELAEKPDIKIEPIGSDITDQGDALEAALDSLLDSGDALNSLLNSSADTLIGDLRAINSQFRVITSLIRSEKSDWSEDRSKDLDDQIKDHFRDESDSCDLEKQHDGRVSASENAGEVRGSMQVGGVIGSIGIETDFDRDEDLNRVGSYSLDYDYLARALAVSCVNSGEVTAQRDYAGGVVGRAFLGQVYGCESYSPVVSTDGSYVGGIAGSSWGSIRESWSKCSLSGTDYIGGTAGYGDTLENCHTLVSVLSGAAYVGAVAGDVDEDGTVQGNTFTHETLGALDGISYAGKAEPVSFADLCAAPGVPETFAQMELTFVADGKTVAVVPFQYGKGIDSLPEIPAKKGCSASWPDLDYLHLTASQTLEAVYTPYSSSLADGSADGLPQILVDGSFSSDAQVSHTTQDVTWTDEKGTVRAGTAYTVTVDDPVLKEVACSVHFRQPESGGRYDLWVQTADGWEQRDFTVDGSYLVFSSDGEEITFCVLPHETNRMLVGAIVLAVLALLVLIVVLISVRRRRRRSRISLPETPEQTEQDAQENEKIHS